MAEAKKAGRKADQTTTTQAKATQSKPVPKCSFHGSTLVSAQFGYKPISSIKIGDWVLSKNEYTGAVNYQQVLNHYNSQYKRTIYVGILDGKGGTHTIISNEIHPFFVRVDDSTILPPSSEGHNYQGDIKNAQWIDASNLKAGYQLLSEDGTWQIVQSVKITEENLSAYNLTVDKNHTYFVSGTPDGKYQVFGAWVHNDCWNSLPDGAVATGKTTPDGRKLYTFKDKKGNQVTAYQGSDGRWYNQRIHPPTQPTATGAKSVDSFPNRDGARAAKGHIYYQTTKEATEAAKKAGFHPTGQFAHKEMVYYNPVTKKYI
ncbi:polymorphic toxin-type HINT domain-containing protein [Moraxella bovoculi]|uniref:polymorphic toxin-type HINT domain-containing protein n=1 Tax=Moraxella bovoculi TaxID=386891 RepID=UPI00072F40D5|nr:polymorphic toxin-type HINT domain-containing protein [Moraxella bovoculi]ALT07582.1 hypothetical protein AAX08_08885 [Moraxella bovoculi]AXR99020.1 hypothetical protein AAX10_10140 [Moraxella bovoculi]